MADARIVELTIPGTLAFRDLALRVVIESCRLVTHGASGDGSNDGRGRSADAALPRAGTPGEGFDVRDAFTTEFVSAFSEIFNNIPIHAYERGDGGTISLHIAIEPDRLVVDITHTGKSFDIDAVPLPEKLPTGGMGIYIARSMLDELEYRPGPPNHWHLAKNLPSRRKPSEPSLASSPPAE